MSRTVAAIDIETIVARARAGESLGPHVSDAPSPDPILILADVIAGSERRVMREWRLKRLGATLAPGGSANSTAREVANYIEAYRSGPWRADRARGRCLATEPCAQLAFEILVLGGPPEKRTLQGLFASQTHPSKLRTTAA